MNFKGIVAGTGLEPVSLAYETNEAAISSNPHYTIKLEVSLNNLILLAFETSTKTT